MADWFQAAVAAIVAIFQPIADPSATTASAAYVTQSSSFSAGLAAARAGDVKPPRPPAAIQDSAPR